MRKLTETDFILIIDAIINEYLGIFGTEPEEIIEALESETDLTREEILENFPQLQDDEDDE